MKMRNLGLIAATLAACLPSLGLASPQRTAINACAQALATSMAPAGTAALAYKLDFRDSQFSMSALDYYPHEYMFELSARDPKTGATLARANCSTNSHAVVTELSLLPLQAHTATFATR